MPISTTPETGSVESALRAELEAKKAELEEMRRLLQVGEHGTEESNAKAHEVGEQIARLQRQLKEFEPKH